MSDELNPSTPTPAGAGQAESLTAQLRESLALLERAAANQSLLAGLSLEERTRLLAAAGELYCPDLHQRRRLVKARVKQRKAEKVQRDQTRLNETGKWRKPITTSVEPAAKWYSAETYHQDYLKKNPGGYTCHFMRP